MESVDRNLFYLGIASEEIFHGRKKERRQGLPVHELQQKLRYPGGSLKVYYGMLPEYGSSVPFSGKGRPWKKKIVQELVQETIKKAEAQLECREIVLAPELGRKEQESPLELLAACLHNYAPFEQVCVSFAEDGGTYQARQAILLLSPYLKRMRQVVFVGEEDSASELLADYLFYEYGIVLEKRKKVPEQMVWLDLDEEKEEKVLFAAERGNILRINSAQTLKFLDTAVKNGYNTGVN